MVYFQTKNPNAGKFWRALEWKRLVYSIVIWNILWPLGIFYGHLVYFMAIWYILWPFGIFYGHLYILRHFGNFVAIWYIFPQFGILCQNLATLIEMCLSIFIQSVIDR
jgi:hypothetical protein